MNWWNLILTVLMVFILISIYNLPNHIYSNLEEKYKNKNNRQLQIESYFKQIGGKKQEELLSEWTDFLIDMKQAEKDYVDNLDSLKSLLHDTVVYGSDRTVKYLEGFKSLAFKKDVDDAEWVVYMVCIVSSLKYDFTGYKVYPMYFIKISIKDYKDYEDKYKYYLDKIYNDID